MERRQKNTEESKKRADTNSRKFICSICLNTRPVEQYKACHICQRSCPTSNGELRETFSESDRRDFTPNTDTKTIQTSQTDVSKGLNLLNEVLNVFQTKKNSDSKTVIVKDAAVSTETRNIVLQKLTSSKIFQHSIEGEFCDDRTRNMFVIVSSSQPCYDRNSQFAVDLNRPKSSSIPQMKLEELKHSLKDIKTNRSKDAVEEVNRMFANVKKVAHEIDGGNRPMTRLGPRVLPVVKTKHYELPPKASPRIKKALNKDCKCCINYNLSSGDSSKNVLKKYEEDRGVQILCCRHRQCSCSSPREKHCNCYAKKNTAPKCSHENGLNRFDDSS